MNNLMEAEIFEIKGIGKYLEGLKVDSRRMEWVLWKDGKIVPPQYLVSPHSATLE